MKSDPGRAKAYLSVCGPNLMLLEQYDLKVIEEWGRALANENKRTSDYYNYHCYGHFRHGNLPIWIHEDNQDLTDMDPSFDFEDLDFDILDRLGSFSDFDSAFDSDFGGDGGDEGDGGDGGD
ncbi:MAG: hypothetical protein JW999_08465 [Methanotrichaceae archaeon]|nr:hypothetical protein [Methanotrichaceae archaeon]